MSMLLLLLLLLPSLILLLLPSLILLLHGLGLPVHLLLLLLHFLICLGFFLVTTPQGCSSVPFFALHAISIRLLSHFILLCVAASLHKCRSVGIFLLVFRFLGIHVILILDA